MAELVLGMGTSHSPQMSSGTRHWDGHAGRDRANDFLVDTDGQVRSYDELEAKAPPSLLEELAPEVWESKWGRVQDAIAVLVKRLADAAPDVAVIVGDDQHELFGDDGNPAIGLFLGDELWDAGLGEAERQKLPPDIMPAQWAAHADERDRYPVARDLSAYLAEALTAADFDIGVFSVQGGDRTLGHAFTFPRRRLHLPPEVPIVPVALNAYYPPNVPRPGRCWALGQALRRALEDWPGGERIALIASGGLSHFVISEELDRRVLDALAAGDEAAVAALPPAVLRSGSSEILNWLVVGGALADWDFDVVDYLAAYRSAAGTGVGLAFATWHPGGEGPVPV
ncbi:MAG: extradiol ring-cleavage dioxygenase [Acidobacteriota bacterium]|nr:extradiol ring-cleavage dioxygenase [Acidobacteriota bacterium]